MSLLLRRGVEGHDGVMARGFGDRREGSVHATAGVYCRAPVISAGPQQGQGQWGTLANPSLLLKLFLPSLLLFSLQTACL